MTGIHKFSNLIIVTGMWHAGTRMIVDILEEAGVDVGRNKTALSETTNDFLNLDLNFFFQDIARILPPRNYPTPDEVHYVYSILERYFDYDRPCCIKLPIFSYIVPYVLQMFPNAKQVGIVRDGRDVALSSLGLGVPTGEPHLSDLGINGLLRFYVWSRFISYPIGDIYKSRKNWRRFRQLKERCYFGCFDLTEFSGVRINNIEFLKAKYPPRPHMFGARLWVESTQNMIASRGHPRYLEVKYEDICTNPKEVIPQLLSDLGIQMPEDRNNLLSIPRKTRIGKFKNTPSVVVDEIVDVAGPLLEKLGYL